MACSNFRTVTETTVTHMQTHRAPSSAGHDDGVLLMLPVLDAGGVFVTLWTSEQCFSYCRLLSIHNS